MKNVKNAAKTSKSAANHAKGAATIRRLEEKELKHVVGGVAHKKAEKKK